jgi:circadian clock protein KaiC
MTATNGRDRTRRSLPKTPTGIRGFDEITRGGLPRGRPTLVCGSAGCGKTLFAAEFLVRGATEFGEPGVFLAFEESEAELAENVRSLGFDLEELVAEKKLVLDHVRVERSEIEETGEYDLEGLFVRLGHAIDTIGAKRVVLDTVETLFGGLSNASILRAELRRLFRWLKARGMTAIVTAERGDGQLTRQGLDEYVSDCVILLDHRVVEQISTRRLRIVKYRGSLHGTNEYPFLIGEDGINVMPITSLGLEHEVSSERVSTGIPRLDAMFGGGGCYRGSTILVTGQAGTGKSSIAAHFADATCRRGERCLYVSFEESPSQILRNMRSIGLDLGAWRERGLLRIESTRSTIHGLETHLAALHARIQEFQPQAVVLDPIGDLSNVGEGRDAASTLARLMDFLKQRGITALMTDMSSGQADGHAELAVSSMVDTWIVLRAIESSGERNRTLHVLKARGMAHSNQVREFLLTDTGVELVDVYLGPDGVLTGSARRAQEARELAAELREQQDIEARRRALEIQRAALEARLTALRRDFEIEEEHAVNALRHHERRREVQQGDRDRMAASRKADGPGSAPGPAHRHPKTESPLPGGATH